MTAPHAFVAIVAGGLAALAVRFYIHQEHGKRWVPGMPSNAEANLYMAALASRLADERLHK